MGDHDSSQTFRRSLWAETGFPVASELSVESPAFAIYVAGEFKTAKRVYNEALSFYNPRIFYQKSMSHFPVLLYLRFTVGKELSLVNSWKNF